VALGWDAQDVPLDGRVVLPEVDSDLDLVSGVACVLVDVFQVDLGAEATFLYWICAAPEKRSRRPHVPSTCRGSVIFIASMNYIRCRRHLSLISCFNTLCYKSPVAPVLRAGAKNLETLVYQPMSCFFTRVFECGIYQDVPSVQFLLVLF